MLLQTYNVLLVSILSGLAAATWQPYNDAIRPDIDDKIGFVSDQCAKTLIPWTMVYNACFQVSLFTKAITRGYFVDDMDEFLTALCSPDTPECAPEDQLKASGELLENCKFEIEDSPGGIPALDSIIMGNYRAVKATLCSKNLNGTLCSTEVMTIIQNALGVRLTFPMLRDALKGNATQLPELAELLETGALCSGCVSRYLYLGSILNTTVNIVDARPYVQAKCGAWFGTKELPDGVDDPDKATLVAAVTRPPIIISKPSSAGATDLVCSATATIASVLGVMVFSLL